MTTVETFGDWLKERRRQLDLTQQELADRAGCSLGTIRKIEQNARRPSKQLAELIGQALAISADQTEAFITFARTDPYTASPPAELIAAAGETAASPRLPIAPAVAHNLTAEPIRHNLPATLTPFIGRRTELAALEELLADADKRLVTIVGPGGMGKTRLALALAERFVDRRQPAATAGAISFPDGVYFVPLAPLTHPDQIPTAIAEAFDLPLEGDRRQRRTVRRRVLDFLQHKRLLLVLDNFEHLLAGADLVTAILDHAGYIRIVATSRERLHLRSEQLYPIEGLQFPDWETPADAANFTAVQLFIQSARRVQPDFALTEEGLPYLSRICRLVEGMPLAVELAAGWVDLLSLPDIAAELQQSIDFLETEERDVPQRHRSMRTVFDGSWERLSDREKEIFPQLSIFRGGFTRQAAQTVADASLRLLGGLLSKSLLQFDQQNDRYQIHELLRQYAAEKLAESPAAEAAVRGLHCSYYANELHALEDDLKGGRQKGALADIEAEFDNVRLAWNCAIEGKKVDQLAKAMKSLGYFLEWTGRYQEGEKLFRRATAALSNEVSQDGLRTRSRLLGWQSYFANFVHEDDQPVALCEQALTLLSHDSLEAVDVRREKAFVLYQMGRAGHNYDRKKEALHQSLALWRELNDPWGIASTLQVLGEPDYWYGSLSEIGAYLEESLKLRRELGDDRGIAHVLILLSTLARYRGQFAKAEPFAREALEITQELGSRATTGRGLYNLGMSMVHLARFEEATDVFRQGERLSQELGDSSATKAAQFGLGEALMSAGQFEKARFYLDKWLTDPVESQDWNRGYLYLFDHRLDEALALFQEDLIKGTSQKNDMYIGITYAHLALTRFFQEKFETAKSLTVQAIQVATTMRHVVVMQHAFAPLVNLMSIEGEVEQALVYDMLARRDHPWIERSALWQWIRKPLLKKVAQLPNDVVAAARAQSLTLDYWATADSLLAELIKRGWEES